jgi:hypothetical protein
MSSIQFQGQPKSKHLIHGAVASGTGARPSISSTPVDILDAPLEDLPAPTLIPHPADIRPLSLRSSDVPKRPSSPARAPSPPPAYDRVSENAIAGSSTKKYASLQRAEHTHLAAAHRAPAKSRLWSGLSDWITDKPATLKRQEVGEHLGELRREGLRALDANNTGLATELF